MGFIDQVIGNPVSAEPTSNPAPPSSHSAVRAFLFLSMPPPIHSSVVLTSLNHSHPMATTLATMPTRLHQLPAVVAQDILLRLLPLLHLRQLVAMLRHLMGTHTAPAHRTHRRLTAHLLTASHSNSSSNNNSLLSSSQEAISRTTPSRTIGQ